MRVRFGWMGICCWACLAVGAAEPPRPNIIYLLCDDLGYGDVRALNPERGKIATPNFDRLAREGLVFTDAHSGSSVCTPTRYGILTGRYAWRTRLQSGVLFGLSAPLIAPGRLTVPALLKQSGYRTACFGKWHLGLGWTGTTTDAGDLKGGKVDYTKPLTDGPLTHGFDTFFGISGSLDMPPFVWIEGDRLTERPTATKKWLREGPAGPSFEAVDVLPALTRRTVEAIGAYAAEARAGKPFFLYVPFASPHTPILPSPEWQGRSGLSPYADFVMQNDACVGEILAALDKHGLARDTLVILTSDNGCSPAADVKGLERLGHYPSAHYRGYKADIWEGGHRVPFICRWPARVRAGSKSAQLVCLTDLLATCAELTGQRLPSQAGEDSFSFLPALLGEDSLASRDAVIHHSINGMFAIRQGMWKLELCPGSGGWCEPRDPAARKAGLPEAQLYDLSADPSETRNLLASRPEQVARLTRLLERAVAEGRSTPGAPQTNDVTVTLRKMDRAPAAAGAATGSGAAETARNTLQAYRATGAQRADRRLRIVCWRTREREFPADYPVRLQRILEHIRDFYAREMARHGLGPLTFPLDTDAAGKLVIHEAVGSGTYDDYTKQEGGGPIREDCARVLRAAGLDPDRETFVIFTNLAKWDPVALTFSHKSPYMGTGSSRGGLAWQLDHPGLDTLNLPLKEPLIQDGEYGRISLGKHNSIFIGGIAHELGHALGLPHARETEEEKAAFGTALMGSGNRTYGDELRGEGKGSFLTLAHALRLASHPLFCGSVKELERPVEAQFSELAIRERPRAFDLTGAVSAEVPVYAVVAYLDPDGNDDYDARTSVARLAADGRFSIRCDALVAGKPGMVRVCALHANGAVSRFQGGYRVAQDGTPDVSAMAVAFELDAFLNALERGDLSRATALRDALPAGARARRHATALLDLRARPRPAVAPAAVPEGLTRVPLSQVAPSHARVGWGSPAYDRLPGREALLIAGGELYETGLYAHAPACYRYDLSGGGWKRLSGTCGLPGPHGSVVFVIRADGKELLRTATLKSGRTQAFSVELTGVRELELITEDAGDSNHSDWGLWLGVTLER